MTGAGLAVITGAAGGLGTAIARRLASADHELVLVDVNPVVDDTAAELARAGATVQQCRADVSEAVGLDNVLECVRAASSPLRVLVNNAGINRDARVEKMTARNFAEVISVNLLAPMMLTAALEPDLDEGSSVINMSSRASLGNFGQVNYVASKAGLVGFTRALAQRLAPRVRVNAVAPGLIATPMTDGMPEHVLSKLVARVPAGRLGTPDDVAALVAYLASPGAAYITGQVILDCGGRSVAP